MIDYSFVYSFVKVSKTIKKSNSKSALNSSDSKCKSGDKSKGNILTSLTQSLSGKEFRDFKSFAR